MLTFIYITESNASVSPQITLFATEAEMKARFVADVINNDRDGYDTEEDINAPSIEKLRALRDAGAPPETQYAMAIDIYDALHENGGAGMPYHWMEEREVPMPHRPGDAVEVLDSLKRTWHSGVVTEVIAHHTGLGTSFEYRVDTEDLGNGWMFSLPYIRKA